MRSLASCIADIKANQGRFYVYVLYRPAASQDIWRQGGAILYEVAVLWRKSRKPNGTGIATYPGLICSRCWSTTETKRRKAAAAREVNARSSVKESKRSRGLALWGDPHYLARQRAAHIAAVTTPTYRAKKSAASLARWGDPAYRERLREVHRQRWARRKQINKE